MPKAGMIMAALRITILLSVTFNERDSSCRITAGLPEALAYVARRGGEWDRSEAYFNEAEQIDPRNVALLTQHAFSYIFLGRFPEALRKLDQVLDITPNDVDTLAGKGVDRADRR